MKIETEYNIEQIVFLITDSDQLKRIITGIQISKNQTLYRLANGITDSWHFDYEFKLHKDYTI